MANLLAGEKTEVETALRSANGGKLPIHVRCLARESEVDSPAGKARCEWIGWICDHWDKAEDLFRSFAIAPPQTEIQESRTKPLTEFIIFLIDPRSVIDNMEFSDSVVRFKICHHHREK
jgi:hypothetical protein